MPYINQIRYTFVLYFVSSVSDPFQFVSNWFLVFLSIEHVQENYMVFSSVSNTMCLLRTYSNLINYLKKTNSNKRQHNQQNNTTQSSGKFLTSKNSNTLIAYISYYNNLKKIRAYIFEYLYSTSSYTCGRCGSDRMVVGFTTTYAISTYHYWCCEFESRSGRREVYNIMW